MAADGGVIGEFAFPDCSGIPLPSFGVGRGKPVEVGCHSVHDPGGGIGVEEGHVVVMKPLSKLIIDGQLSFISGRFDVIVEIPPKVDTSLREGTCFE